VRFEEGGALLLDGHEVQSIFLLFAEHNTHRRKVLQ
jgi:hypothetical protein